MKDEFRRGPHRPEKEPFSAEVEGTVSQYLLNPRGEVDGLLLEDRTVIKFPPHLARELVEVIKPSERVHAIGHSCTSPLMPGDSSRSFFAKENLLPGLASERSMILAEPSLLRCLAAQPMPWF
jgi:hypothetical protein